MTCARSSRKAAFLSSYTLTVTAGGKSVSLGDVMIGDVYLCAGQSNMEFAVRASTNAWSNMSAAFEQQAAFPERAEGQRVLPTNSLTMVSP
jgi:sialate O-acetylesterase